MVVIWWILACALVIAVQDTAVCGSTPQSTTVKVVHSELQLDQFHNWLWPQENISEGILEERITPFQLKLRGSGFRSSMSVRFTAESMSRGSSCKEVSMWPESFRFSGGLASDLAHLNARLPLSVASRPVVLYLCLSSLSTDAASNDTTENWVHQGKEVNFTLKPELAFSHEKSEEDHVSLSGVRAEGDRVYFLPDGVTSIPADQWTTLRLMGNNFMGGKKLLIALTLSRRARGSCCDDLPTLTVLPVSKKDILADNVMIITVNLPELEDGEFFYFCVKDSSSSGKTSWTHQGDEPWLRIFSEGRTIPKWIQVCLIVLLQVMSGLFSGLNLGLMSLDKTELKIIAKCGTRREKEYARIIAPLRSRGNYLLCSIVLGNVLVNSLLTVMLDDLTSGLVAVVGSTVGIVIFGEIIPQAICSRHGLAVGAMTVWITRLFMVLTFPMSYPISKLLDICLGEEICNVYDRERLIEYIKVVEDYKKLEKGEVNIISGALELKKKTARDVMTPMEDVFMLSVDAVLDFETVAEIIRQGYTRVPVFEADRSNVVSMLHTKDLALVDPDDNTSVKSLCHFYNHPIIFAFEDERLDTLLDEFKKGKSHLACVRSVRNTPNEDPSYVLEGIVTLEDVIEEIIQSEIMDETDTLTDNRRKQRRKGAQIVQDFSDFVKIGSGKSIISPQLALAVFQFLSTSVEAFRKNLISESVLRRLLTQNIFFSLKQRSTGVSSADFSRSVVTLYKAGKPADFFLLILEGRVKVTVGKEKLVYEAGPFSYFGVPAIMYPLPPGEVSFLMSTPRCGHHHNHSSSLQGHSMSGSLLQVPGASPAAASLVLPVGSSSFISDYTLVAASDVVYMKINKSVYTAALKATLLERQHRSDTSIDECFRECSRRGDSITPSQMKTVSPPVPSPPLSSDSKTDESPEVRNYGDALSPNFLLTTGSASVSAFNFSS